MRRLVGWIVCVVVGCGSSEATPAAEPGATRETTTMSATPEPSTAPSEPTLAEPEAPSATAASPAPTPSPLDAEPVIPEDLRESYTRLRARVDEAPNDLAARCSLGSLLRRAHALAHAHEMLTEALRPPLDGDGEPRTLEPGTIEACAYELGRVAEESGDLGSAADHYWAARQTPIERRRRIVDEAFWRVMDARLASSCDLTALELRGLLTHADRPSLRRCLREVESASPPCPILPLGDPDHPGVRPDAYDEFVEVGDEGSAFGRIGTTLYVISAIRGRKQVRQCEFALSDPSDFGRPTVLTLGETTLYGVTTSGFISYASDECDECRETDAFGATFVFSAVGELRLALVDAGNENSMVNPGWTSPWLEVEGGGLRADEEGTLQIGRPLMLRSHVFVPKR
ncbi:MAG: hypothetical protein H6721_20055 [Sandaracinus sp.]|nr:hypothetical protein [Myxococcales bacterium]MCB9604391.1 hypothetical protein [Sandaracinus sp.]MCB9617181.1 hypothetical protein [Sandaracinus sp.]MCB9634423.1 hypothetical protein [Sandaracinus sp.]